MSEESTVRHRNQPISGKNRPKWDENRPFGIGINRLQVRIDRKGPFSRRSLFQLIHE
ncbi:hypothetical protein [Lentibacillus juripiscarius]|uniref:Uncharacterized protein n=1 Tax=Lentibacillus juripiscarius TaxID=257446 RepID=A0ABW5VA24_9BACI